MAFRYIFHSNFGGKARANIPFKSSNIISDKNGRFIIVSGKLYNKSVILANVYAPNFDNVQFFKRFFSQLPDLNSYSFILGGDFNCYLDPVLDRSSPIRTGFYTPQEENIHSFHMFTIPIPD